MRLPGVCIVCRQNVWWNSRSWRDRNGKAHACPMERPVCGGWMPVAKERCARPPGHTTEHRTRYAMDNAYYMKTGRKRAA